MTTRSFILYLVSSLLVLSANAETATNAAAPKTVRLLNIGNSFSGNATRYLRDLTKAAGHILIHRQASIGGSSLQQHWDKAQLHERDPKNPAGFYNTKRSLKQELQSEAWDFVTIQQASIRSHDVATYRPYAAALRDYVKQHAPGATLLLHQTWAYRKDDPRFSSKNTKPGEPLTQQAMYDQLREAYAAVASELGVATIPSGDAFYSADTDPIWGFVGDPSFNPKTAEKPTVPRETHSLHMGWHWKRQKDGTEKLIMDGHHANTAGQYLGSCVFFEVVFSESVVGNSFTPLGLDKSYATFLQETAHRAVQQRTK